MVHILSLHILSTVTGILSWIIHTTKYPSVCAIGTRTIMSSCFVYYIEDTYLTKCCSAVMRTWFSSHCDCFSMLCFILLVESSSFYWSHMDIGLFVSRIRWTRDRSGMAFASTWRALWCECWFTLIITWSPGQIKVLEQTLLTRSAFKGDEDRYWL